MFRFERFGSFAINVITQSSNILRKLYNLQLNLNSLEMHFRKSLSNPVINIYDINYNYVDTRTQTSSREQINDLNKEQEEEINPLLDDSDSNPSHERGQYGTLAPVSRKNDENEMDKPHPKGIFSDWTVTVPKYFMMGVLGMVLYVFVSDESFIIHETHSEIDSSQKSKYYDEAISYTLQQPPQEESHVRRTLLSILDPETKKTVDALNNPLYQRMAQSRFIMPVERASNSSPFRSDTNKTPQNVDPQIPMWINKQRISFHDSLTLSFMETSNEFPLYDSDILALYCPAHETEPKRYRDAATIQQIRQTSQTVRNVVTTSRKKSSSNTLSFLYRYMDPLDNALDENSDNSLSFSDMLPSLIQWHIPSFPILREDTCEFRLWRNMTTNFEQTMKRSSSNGEEDEDISDRRKLEEQQATNQNTLRLASATDPFIIHSAKTEPTAIHLAFTKNPSEMNVRFTTGSVDLTEQGKPTVYYMETSHLQNHPISDKNDQKIQWSKAFGITTTYSNTDMCDAPANETDTPGIFLDPGQLHSVTLTHLKYDTSYTYKVAILPSSISSETVQGMTWSSQYTFRSAPAPGTFPIVMLAYGDQGSGSEEDLDPGAFRVEQEIQLMVEEETNESIIRAIHHIGDLSYAMGAAHMWDEWESMMEPIVARVPLMIGVGNHEYAGFYDVNPKEEQEINRQNNYSFQDMRYNFTESGGECGIPTSKRFTMPDNGNGAFWYSYDVGGVHIVMISTELHLSKNSIQYQWLKHDLEHVNRNITPFVILESHYPMYNSIALWENHLEVGLLMQRQFEYLLRKHKVDLYLSGHYHAYLRTCAGLYEWKCDNGGPIHITVGTAGRSLLENVTLFPQDWTETFLPGVYGFGKVTATNKTALLWEFIGGDDATVLDHVWILREDL